MHHLKYYMPHLELKVLELAELPLISINLNHHVWLLFQGLLIRELSWSLLNNAYVKYIPQNGIPQKCWCFCKTYWYMRKSYNFLCHEKHFHQLLWQNFFQLLFVLASSQYLVQYTVRVPYYLIILILWKTLAWAVLDPGNLFNATLKFVLVTKIEHFYWLVSLDIVILIILIIILIIV